MSLVRIIRLAAVLSAALHSAAGVLQAQTIRGQLIDGVSRAPLQGAFVTLVDDRGAERARAITDPAGQFTLNAPAAGPYRLRSKRIGFRPYLSPPLVLHAGETTTYTAAVDPIPVVLAELVIAGERQCDVDAGASVAALWDEVREALAVVAWSSRVPGYWYDVAHFQRELTPGGRRGGLDSTWRQIGYQQAPFRSAPAADLERHGYVIADSDGMTYFAPDADVLISDPFLRSHCFETKVGRGESEGLVGLAFTPARDRRVPDITGTLWVDRKTGELRDLEFRYARLPDGLPEKGAGGRVEFMRVPTGAWIVRDWVIRAPIARIVRTSVGQDAGPHIVGFRETGASAVEIKTSSGAIVYRAASASGPVAAGPVAVPPPAAPPVPLVIPTVVRTDEIKTDSSGTSSTRAGPHDPDILLEDEFQDSRATDALTLVQHYRPNWLHSRGPISILDQNAGELKIYVDGALMGDVSRLREVPVVGIHMIRHLGASDAMQRYGNGHGGGVIEVWTKRH